MKKLLLLLGILSLVGGCTGVFASKKVSKMVQKEPFTYVEVGTFTAPFEDSGVTACYGMRRFYKSNLAFDSSLFMGFGFNGDFLVSYKYVGLIYFYPMKSKIAPYAGIGGLTGMVSCKDIHKDRSSTIASNGLAVLGCDIDIQGKTHFISATYHLNSNAILVSVGRTF